MTIRAPAQTARNSRLSALTGACAVVGGAAWVTACVLHASQPSGCVGAAECSSVPMRESTSATAFLVAVAGLLLVGSGAGLLAMMRRRSRLARATVVGATLAGVGLALLAVAVTVQSLFYAGDFPSMPVLVGPGVVLLALGVAVVGWTVLRSRVLPRWAGTSLLVGAVLLPVANEQTVAVLLAVPFGLAWVAAGVTLLARSPQAPTARS